MWKIFLALCSLWLIILTNIASYIVVEMTAILERLDFDFFRRLISTCFVLWLALRFGLSLCGNQIPFIERVARYSSPEMTLKHQSYVRVLTWIWFVYFLSATLLTAFGYFGFPWDGLLIAVSSAFLFVCEHWFRPYLFPGQLFPSVLTQLKHTRCAWRAQSFTTRSNLDDMN